MIKINFYGKLEKKISHNERHDVPLGIPIQHIDGGQLLIVNLGFTRSYYDEDNVFHITPSLIEKYIRRGIESGWKYNESGKQFELGYSDIPKQ